MPFLTMSTFAPTCSHKLATSFINEILVARNEFAAYLVSSAEASSIKIIGLPWRTYGAYSSFINFLAGSEVVPITIRSGFMKSSTATPSRKNSGLETTSKGCFVKLDIVRLTSSAVPTGTVLLSTITV